MTTINNVGMNGVNEVNFKGNDKKGVVADNKPSTDKKMKTSTKLMIGATALAAVVVGGIMLHNAKAKVFGVDKIKQIIGNSDDLGSAVLIKRNDKSAKLFENIDDKIKYLLIKRKNDGKVIKQQVKGVPTEELNALFNDDGGVVRTGNLLHNSLFGGSLTEFL